MINIDFIKVLISNKISSKEELQSLLKLYEEDVFSVIAHLIREEIVKKEIIGQLCGDFLGIAYTNLEKTTIQPYLAEKIPEEVARTNKVIPLYKFGNTVTVATSDPQNVYVLDKLEKLLRCQVSPLFSFPEEIDEAIDKIYSSGDLLKNLTKKNIEKEKEPETNKKLTKKENPKIEINIKKEKAPEIDKSLLAKPVFSESSQKELIDDSKEFINDAFNGQIPKASTTIKISNFIVNQINNKIDVIFGFNQLKIKDEYTYSHCLNVAALTAVVCKALGIEINTIRELTLAALLHDIGKMRVPKIILYKPGPLTAEELEIAKRHPQMGYQIIKMMDLSDNIANVALNHHERLDGRGYPRKLKGEALSLHSQIISISDIYDDLVSDKPYRKALNHHEALNIMLLEGYQAFNSTLLRLFVSFAYKQNYESLKETFKSSVYGEII